MRSLWLWQVFKALWTIRYSRSRCARFCNLAEALTRKTFLILRPTMEGWMKRIFRTRHGWPFARLREVVRIRRRVCALDRRAKGANRMNRYAMALIDVLVNAIAAIVVAANSAYYQNVPNALTPLRRIPPPPPRRILDHDPRFHLLLWARLPLCGVKPRLEKKSGGPC